MANTTPRQEMLEKAQEVVMSAISDFRFSNYGLDIVEDEDTDTEWIGDLAADIAEALFGGYRS